jgi:hypothetical protein
LRRADVIAFALLIAILSGCSEPNDLRALEELEDDLAASDAGPDASEVAAACQDAVTRESMCKVGVGACERTGTLSCDDASEGICSVTAGTPKLEQCANAIDDDCDGMMDEPPAGKCCEDSDCVATQACEREGSSGVPGVCVDVGDSHADCEADGSAVTCTCHPGYVGDGFTCERDFCAPLEGEEPPCGDNQNCSVQDDEALCDCEEGFNDCDEAADNGCEVDVLGDAEHCGRCGQSCASDLGCIEGVCELRVTTMVLGAYGTLAKLDNGSWLGAGAAITPPPGATTFVQTTAAPAASYSLALNHGCGLRDGGSAFCWGSNGSNNLLGSADTTVKQFEIPKAGLRAIATNTLNTCVAGSEGAVYCWGSSHTGAWGDGVVPTTRTAPRTAADAFASPVAGVVGAVKLHVGESMFCALTEGKFAWCWGSSGSTGFATESVKGTNGLPLGGIEDLAGGLDHACALIEDKSVVCWGDPTNGVLGSAATPAGRHLAVKVPLESVRSIAGGAGHVCAALEDGTVQCWGHNPFGELGSMTTATSSAAPIAVPLPENEEALQVYSGSPSRSTCAQMRSGRVYCWGFNRYGNLGVPVSGAGPSGTLGPMVSAPAEVTSWP